MSVTYCTQYMTDKERRGENSSESHAPGHLISCVILVSFLRCSWNQAFKCMTSTICHPNGLASICLGSRTACRLYVFQSMRQAVCPVTANNLPSVSMPTTYLAASLSVTCIILPAQAPQVSLHSGWLASLQLCCKTTLTYLTRQCSANRRTAAQPEDS